MSLRCHQKRVKAKPRSANIRMSKYEIVYGRIDQTKHMFSGGTANVKIWTENVKI